VYKSGDNVSLFRGGAAYADAITFGTEEADKTLVDEFSKCVARRRCRMMQLLI
jgi:starch synthase